MPHALMRVVVDAVRVLLTVVVIAKQRALDHVIHRVMDIAIHHVLRRALQVVVLSVSLPARVVRDVQPHVRADVLKHAIAAQQRAVVYAQEAAAMAVLGNAPDVANRALMDVVVVQEAAV